MKMYRVETYDRHYDVEAARATVKEGFVIFVKYDSDEERDREVALFPVATVVRVLDLERVKPV